MTGKRKKPASSVLIESKKVVGAGRGSQTVGVDKSGGLENPLPNRGRKLW